MASKIKKYLPKRFYTFLRKVFLVRTLFSEYFIDFKRYLKYSSIISVNNDDKFLGRVLATYHVVEKGLSMPDKRMGFGGENIISLCRLVKEGDQRRLGHTIEIRAAVASLKQYYEEHTKAKYTLNKSVQTALDSIKVFFSNEYAEYGGSKSIHSKELLENWKIDFPNFIKNRHSIRNYSDKPVDLTIIRDAIDLANHSPSVCNRQSSRVLVITDREEIQNALKFQNGNRGFGHLCQVLLVIASDLSSFHEYQERNQCFIDTGLFSMSLLYSLQSYGLGACPLNWCSTSTNDLNFKKTLNVPSNYVISMMISVGHLPEKIQVAISKRKASELLIL